MARTPSPAGRRWTLVGLSLATVHLVLISGVALTDGGRLTGDWAETVPWLLIVAMPGLLALAGLRNASALLWAGGISLPLALLSLAGATLPLVLPAICYFAGYAASMRKPTLS